MVKVPRTWRRNIAENFNRLSRVHERYRRQTADDDIYSELKSPRESWNSRLDTLNDLLETLYNFSDFFLSAFKQQMVIKNKQNAELSVLTFLGHSICVTKLKHDSSF